MAKKTGKNRHAAKPEAHHHAAHSGQGKGQHAAPMEIPGLAKPVALVIAAVAIVAILIVAFTPTNQPSSPPSTMPGSDRDAHGCIGSAGYTWCEENQKCIRPWEESCASSGLAGADTDSHGCIPSAGYVWCEEKQACLRLWEENCTTNSLVGANRDEHGCIPSAGYLWCNDTRECFRPWAENCTSYADTSSEPEPGPVLVGSDRDEHGCIGSAGYVWCEEKQKCLRPWEENCTAASVGTADSPANESNASNTSNATNGTDDYGCDLSQGYAWCEELQSCTLAGGCISEIESEALSYCDGKSKVYVCGTYIKAVSPIAGDGAIFYKAGDSPVVCGEPTSQESVTPQCRLLMDNCAERRVC